MKTNNNNNEVLKTKKVMLNGKVYDITQFDICLKYSVVRKIQVDMKCMYCGTPLIFTGNVGCNEHGDYKDSDPATISYFDCPKCGRSYEVWEPNEEDRNTKFNDYWNK